MRPPYFDAVPVKDNKFDQIGSLTFNQHIHHIDRRIISLWAEMLLAMIAIVAPAAAAVRWAQHSHWWSPAWAAAFAAVVIFAVLVDFRSWFDARIARINAWVEIRHNHLVRQHAENKAFATTH